MRWAMVKDRAEPTRREKEESARRAHILKVAERLLAERGLNEASMAEIAKDAEFGVGTLYKYFEDKNSLIRSLIEDRMSAHLLALEAALTSEGAPEEVIARLVGAYLDSIKQRRAFFKFFMTSFHPGVSQEGCPIDLAFVEKGRDRVIDLMRGVFQRGIDAGRFTSVGADSLSTGLFGMMMSFTFFGEIQLHGEWDAREFEKTILRIFFQPVLLAESAATTRRPPSRRGR
jgi:AcrR family transcriptional regulator